MRLTKRVVIIIDGDDRWVEGLIAELNLDCDTWIRLAERDGMHLTAELSEEVRGGSSRPSSRRLVQSNVNIVTNFPAQGAAEAQVAAVLRELGSNMSLSRRTRKGVEPGARDIEDVMAEIEREEERKRPRQIRFRKRQKRTKKAAQQKK